ncbi:MAG TPA: 2,3-bisphosphoglycerate-independent phosphoglycerate mutase [Gemmatimonadaceae bacterium]|nr:2,3-bisphosphoglycerate-independent phosphoglycerate mutase [Gemmatimonadaceae bacterium]
MVLLVLDGWGFRAEREGNAIALAATPTWDALWSRPSRTLLEASGLRVGVPEGQMGNSEVGHLNLGAGRVVQQDIVRILSAIGDGSFFSNSALVAACRTARERGSTLHLLGLLGSGGVHALDRHLFALIDLAERERVPRVAIHPMTDGRDTLPMSGLGYMHELLEYARGRAQVASVGGRYFGMDRDRRWHRTEQYYRAAIEGVGPEYSDPLDAITSAYATGITDEFIPPAVITDAGAPRAPMRDGDVVICFNFRADRMRQIVRALSESPFTGFDVSSRPALRVTTMTGYDATFEVPAAFEPFSLARILAEIVSGVGLTQFRTAETEKYAHVTYFFNGGVEPPYPGEERILVPSPQVATYDLQPEMSAYGVTDVLCRSIEGGAHNFVLANYANADMVGHTGSMPATISAVESVDRCLARVVESCSRSGARLIVTADHGNAEMMIDPQDGGPHTAHTTNPVPLVLLDRDDRPLRQGGALCDVAPTILSLLALDQPAEMTGQDLRHLD